MFIFGSLSILYSMNEYFIHYYTPRFLGTRLISPGIVVASCPSAARLLGASLFGQVVGHLRGPVTSGGICACSFPPVFPVS